MPDFCELCCFESVPMLSCWLQDNVRALWGEKKLLHAKFEESNSIHRGGQSFSVKGGVLKHFNTEKFRVNT